MQAVSRKMSEDRLAVVLHVGGGDRHEGDIPWATAAAWREGWRSLATTIAAAGEDLGPARAIARRILHRYELAGDLFDALAETSCGLCRRPCCRDARVWLDFRDLLVIHLSGQPPPPAQLRCNRRERCRYLTSQGCTLPRGARPWVCTWYVCPAQRRILKRDIPGGPERLAGWWQEITALRKAMEDAFISVAHR